MADPSWATHLAIFDALAAGLSIPVYDDVPKNSAYPYVTISAQVIANDDPVSSRRDERFFTLTVWSTAAGQKEVLDTIAEIHTALHRKQLTLTIGRMVKAFVIRKVSNRDADGETYQGTVTVRVLTEH